MEKNRCYIPNFFFNAMIKNIKIQNIFNIIEISKFMQPNKYLFLNYKNVFKSVSYGFSKFNGSREIKV